LDRVFLDANVLFAAAWAPRSRLLRLWDIETAALITSPYAVEEARRNLPRPAQRGRLNRLLRDVEVVTPPHEPGRSGRLVVRRLRRRPWRTRQADAVELPPDDRPILQAAVAARATHLLTGNHRDFGAYYWCRVAGVLILPPSEYPPLTSGPAAT